MSTISSVPSNQIFTTTGSSTSVEVSHSSKDTSSSSTSLRKSNEQTLLKSSPAKSTSITEILTVLKKVLEAVTSLLQLFGKEKGTNTSREITSGTTPSQNISPSDCGKIAQSPPQSTSSLSKSGEFLWKPQSDKDGRLAVLLPSALVGKVDSVAVASPSGAIEKGKYAGVGNGSREHFRFSKPGGDFQDGSRVIIAMKDGSNKEITISDSSARFQM